MPNNKSKLADLSADKKALLAMRLRKKRVSGEAEKVQVRDAIEPDVETHKEPSPAKESRPADRKPAPAAGAFRPGREPVLRGLKNRILQVFALYTPGLRRRAWLHRMRGVQIGENVNIGTAAIIETSQPQLVSIGNNVEIGIRAVIIGHFRETANQARAEGRPSVRIEDDVFVGPMVTILPPVTIGRGSVVAAGSVVSQSVPPKTVVQGNPAKPVARCELPLVGNTYAAFAENLAPIDDAS